MGITSGRQLFGEVRLDCTSLQDDLVKLCDDYVIIPYMEKREKYIDVYVWDRAGAASHAVAGIAMIVFFIVVSPLILE